MRVLGVRVLASVSGTVGLVDLAGAVVPGRTGQVSRSAAGLLAGQPLTRAQALMLGMVLLTVAHGVAGRRRLARQVALTGLAVGTVAAVPGQPARVGALGLLLIVLLGLRDQFPTRPDGRRIRTAAQVGAAVFLIVLVTGGWDVAVDRTGPRAVGDAIVATLFELPSGRAQPATLLAFLVSAGTATVLLLAFAPAAAPRPGNPAQRSMVAALTAQPGADSLAPFATRADKTYVFSPDGRAAIGYRVVFGTALAAGDPVGDPAIADAAIAEFLDRCARYGWRPAVLGASDAARPAWRRAGLRGLVIGDEAVLDVATFSLASRKMRNVRQAVARTRNAGITVSVGRLDAGLAERLAPVLVDWLDGRGERGFAMNLDRVLVPRPDCLVAVAEGPDGQIQAFARFAVCGGGRVLTLDIAPRRSGAANGVVERLIIEMVAYAGTVGAEEVSLNFAGLRRVFEVRGPLAPLVRAVTHLFDQWIELGSLYRFCAKFQPTWRPRSLLVRSWLDLGQVTAASLAAEFGDRPAVAAGPGWIPSQQTVATANSAEQPTESPAC